MIQLGVPAKNGSGSFVATSQREQKASEIENTTTSGKANPQPDQSGLRNRFSIKRAPTVIADSSTATATHPVASRSPPVFNGQPSIAAATVIGILVFAAFLFLAIWYIRRARRVRSLRNLQNHSQDPFSQSSVTLAEDTSKALEDFLMKDVRPERTSLMFSRSRSPSITFVVDDARRRSLSRLYRNSYDASTSSLSKLDTLTRVSADTSRPSFIVSELTATTQSTSNTATLQASSNRDSATPRASMSMSSTVPTTIRSSQLWTTTTGTTANSSLLSCDATSSQASPTMCHSSNSPPSSASSLARSYPSNASRASSRRSGQGPPQFGVRLSYDSASARRYHVRSHSRSSQGTVVSPVTEPGSSSSQCPSISSTPPPGLRLSEA
ncbi:uncharacterized protein N7482_007455 [Penicillium canariense]|uniref:Uncharacterized protein n=1 Tax=Penicillium canariense TaxID=189055 RepID=A0A9W9HZ43_9EURO|nr:uncharacterized protein N7482_007455 [Penicillium canariense]KAJ5160451.1 hypothetical protein N7482_007455 [Penicillium canariense]